jgi:hypothetical protein
MSAVAVRPAILREAMEAALEVERKRRLS